MIKEMKSKTDIMLLAVHLKAISFRRNIKQVKKHFQSNRILAVVLVLKMVIQVINQLDAQVTLVDS